MTTQPSASWRRSSGPARMSSVGSVDCSSGRAYCPASESPNSDRAIRSHTPSRRLVQLRTRRARPLAACPRRSGAAPGCRADLRHRRDRRHGRRLLHIGRRTGPPRSRDHVGQPRDLAPLPDPGRAARPPRGRSTSAGHRSRPQPPARRAATGDSRVRRARGEGDHGRRDRRARRSVLPSLRLSSPLHFPQER